MIHYHILDECIEQSKGTHQHQPDTEQFDDYLPDDLTRFSTDTRAHCHKYVCVCVCVTVSSISSQ